jgi:hypothetical protein
MVTSTKEIDKTTLLMEEENTLFQMVLTISDNGNQIINRGKEKRCILMAQFFKGYLSLE